MIVSRLDLVIYSERDFDVPSFEGMDMAATPDKNDGSSRNTKDEVSERRPSTSTATNVDSEAQHRTSDANSYAKPSKPICPVCEESGVGNTFKIGTWNVTTLQGDETNNDLISIPLDSLLKTVNESELDITALQEVRWTKKMQDKYKSLVENKGYKMYYEASDDSGSFGVAFLLSPRLVELNPDLTFIPENKKEIRKRLSYIRIKVNEFFFFSMLNVHAETNVTEADVKDSYYEELKDVFTRRPESNDIRIVLGDFNAEVGREQLIYAPTIGKHSVHPESNDNGRRLIDFAMSFDLRIASTNFKHKRKDLVTCESRRGERERQIDHVLIDSKYGAIITDCKNNRKATTRSKSGHPSDHFLVIATIDTRIISWDRHFKYFQLKCSDQIYNQKSAKDATPTLDELQSYSKEIGPYQGGIRDRKMTGQIYCLRKIVRRTRLTENFETHHVFLRLRTAAVLKSEATRELYDALQTKFNIPESLVERIEETMQPSAGPLFFLSTSEPCDLFEHFQEKDLLPCMLFFFALEAIVRSSRINPKGNIYKDDVQIIAYINEIVIIGRNETVTGDAFLSFQRHANAMGLVIDHEPKYMIVHDQKKAIAQLQPTGDMIRIVNEFGIRIVNEVVYLDSLINNKGNDGMEVRRRIVMAKKYYQLAASYLDQIITDLEVKRKFYEDKIRPFLFHGVATMILGKEPQEELQRCEADILKKIFKGEDQDIWKDFVNDLVDKTTGEKTENGTHTKIKNEIDKLKHYVNELNDDPMKIAEDDKPPGFEQMRPGRGGKSYSLSASHSKLPTTTYGKQSMPQQDNDETELPSKLHNMTI